jgi:superfamily I DNA/RNA helicase
VVRDDQLILGFAERHPGQAQIVLGRNFRSRAEILQAAVSCVQHNEHRAPKALIAMRGSGGQVRVVGLSNEFQEAHWVAGQFAEALAAGTSPAEVLAARGVGPRPARGDLIAASANAAALDGVPSETAVSTWTSSAPPCSGCARKSRPGARAVTW